MDRRLFVVTPAHQLHDELVRGEGGPIGPAPARFIEDSRAPEAADVHILRRAY